MATFQFSNHTIELDFCGQEHFSLNMTTVSGGWLVRIFIDPPDALPCAVRGSTETAARNTFRLI